jgi:hypothetical protein
MDDYTYATLGTGGCFRCDGVHRPGFLTLLRDVLHRFSHTGTPAYRGCLYREFGRGRCEVHVDIPAHPSDPSMTAWFTTATGDDETPHEMFNRLKKLVNKTRALESKK